MPTKIEKDQLSGQYTTGHEWDGLKELNTPLPKWWLYVFYATVVFAIVWMIAYPSLPVRGLTGVTGWIAREAVVQDVARHNAQREPMLARLRAATPQEIAADPELRAFAIAGGRIAFAKNCAACHGTAGQGAEGGFPSLVDDDWIFGGNLDTILRVTRHGVRNGEDPDALGIAMPRYLVDGLLTAAQVNDVTEYVLAMTNRATDAAAAARGAPLYAENCAACHGNRGEGNRDVGAPRLNDQIWLYGGDRAAVRHSIAYSRAGVMPGWQTRLDPAIVNILTVFVHSLGGGEN